MTPLLFALPGNEPLCTNIASALHAELGVFEYRRFPDGESYVRLRTDVARRHVALVCTLNAPDEKTLALLFAARTARELGAASVGLVAPYLAYMRQDARFQPGEAITSAQFAALVSQAFDWLVTADPHLHRRASLGEIYPIVTRTVHCAPLLAAWISAQVPAAWVVGPDVESEQWVASVASAAAAPHATLRKLRRGDRDVEVVLPDVARWHGRTPVIVDDIVSSARTMAVACRRLREAGFAAPVCLGIHAVFAGDAYEQLVEAGAARIVTTNTIAHRSNEIDATGLLAEAARECIEQVAAVEGEPGSRCCADSSSAQEEDSVVDHCQTRRCRRPVTSFSHQEETMRYRFWLVVPGVLFALQAAAQLATQKVVADGVTVAVTPGNLAQGVKTWDFTVVFDTHTQDLSDDPAQSAVLLDGKGNQFKPSAWEGAKPGGHHREGVLKFAPISPPPDSVELRIMRPGETTPRTFRWQLK